MAAKTQKKVRRSYPVDEELHRRFRIRSTELGIIMDVSDPIRDWLRKVAKKRKTKKPK